jgi:hypothetical protein
MSKSPSQIAEAPYRIFAGLELERLEAKFATAGEADANELDQYARVAANMRRLFEAVGLKRRSRDVTPSLGEYLASLPKNGDIDV